MKNKGKIVCTRIISYNEIISLLKNNSIDEAINFILKNEQNEWKKNNKSKIYNKVSKTINPNPKFFIDCFPHWEYYINGKCYLKNEINNSDLISKTIWDVETKIDYDAKLKAFILLKKGK